MESHRIRRDLVTVQILNGERLNTSQVQKQEYPFSPLLFSIVLEVLTTAVKQENELKGI